MLNLNINSPEDWRDGQTIFNFLEWLKNEKGVDGNQNARLADTFHLSNEQLQAYADEYSKLFEKP